MRGFLITAGVTVICACVLVILPGCAAVEFYERNVKPIPCAPMTCTQEELEAEDTFTPVGVDLGPYRDGRVTP